MTKRAHPHEAIASELRAEILAGRWDAPDDPFPSNTDIADRFGVSRPTAARAVQALITERLLIARHRQRAIIQPPDRREALRGTQAWTVSGRYRAARAAGSLVFAGDVDGELTKRTLDRRWVEAEPLVADLLQVDIGSSVLARSSRTYLDERPVENTTMYFPPAVVEAAPDLERAEAISVVALIEATGRQIGWTRNLISARHATTDERDVLRLPADGIVFEHVHATLTTDFEPVEVVVNVKPADGTVLMVETDEGPEVGT